MKTSEEYVKDYWGEIKNGCNKRGEALSQYDVEKVIQYAITDSYNQGVKDAAENAKMAIVNINGHFVPDGSIDKESILNLIKK